MDVVTQHTNQYSQKSQSNASRRVLQTSFRNAAAERAVMLKPTMRSMLKPTMRHRARPAHADAHAHPLSASSHGHLYPRWHPSWAAACCSGCGSEKAALARAIANCRTCSRSTTAPNRHPSGSNWSASDSDCNVSGSGCDSDSLLHLLSRFATASSGCAAAGSRRW